MTNKMELKEYIGKVLGYVWTTSEGEIRQEVAKLLYSHPVMQEGKEKVYSPPHGLASRLPVDDEQPEHRGMPLFPTPYSDTDIHPRSAPPNDPGAHSMNC